MHRGWSPLPPGRHTRELATEYDNDVQRSPVGMRVRVLALTLCGLAAMTSLMAVSQLCAVVGRRMQPTLRPVERLGVVDGAVALWVPRVPLVSRPFPHGARVIESQTPVTSRAELLDETSMPRDETRTNTAPAKASTRTEPPETEARGESKHLEKAVETEAPLVQSSPTPVPTTTRRLTTESLLQLGERILSNQSDAYPEAIFELDWSTVVPRRAILHLGALQRACMSHQDAILPWTFGMNVSGTGVDESEPRLLTQVDASVNQTTEAILVDALRQCATVDIYMRQDVRVQQGYCEDASAYIKYLQGRILPDWVFKRTFFDRRRNAQVSYHDLCPKTPLLVFNHYWDDVRDRADWPPTKPLYLMPNIEMFELKGTHYREADVILCKTAVCATYLAKWFEQEGNPRMTRVLYTRFTSSDAATNALALAGVEALDDGWQERRKDFDNVSFTHTAGTSLWKGTHQVLDCWTTRPDLPLLKLYVDGGRFHSWYLGEYETRVQSSANIQLHTGTMDAISFGRMIADSAFFLCTSEMEGYGHYINHARASGGLVITTHAPPMNELITPSSGVLVESSLSANDGQFLGGTSPEEGALRGVPGYVASFKGKHVCDAVDTIVNGMDHDERKRRAHRARQQFFYDTAFFADKMKRLGKLLRPHGSSTD